MNLAILSPIWPEAVARLKDRHVCREVFNVEPVELCRALAAVEAVVVRSGVRLDRPTLKAAPRLRLIVRAGTGLDGIDQACAREQGIHVVVLPLSATAVAEHTFALLLGLARKVTWLDRQLRAGHWEKHAGLGCELGGKSLGLLGFGRIGQRTAELAHAFRMTVLTHDRSPDLPEKQRAAQMLGVRFVGLAELFETADTLAIQVPLNEQTRGLVGADLLGRMRPGALLVNIGRGQVVDEDALYDLLREGRLGGAALDVFAHEPAGDCPLLQLDNFIGTPHVGAQTLESQREIGEAVVRAIEEFSEREGKGHS